MCRAVDHGGRRCPSCEPTARSAQRKASKAAAGVQPIGNGEDVTVEDSTSFDVKTIDDVVETLKEPFDLMAAVNEIDGEATEAQKQAVAEGMAANKEWSKSIREVHGGRHSLMIKAGQVVASEAERRAGTNGETIRRMCREFEETHEARLQEIAERIKVVRAQVLASPEYERYTEVMYPLPPQSKSKKARAEYEAAYRDYMDRQDAVDALPAQREWNDLEEEQRGLTTAKATGVPAEAGEHLMKLGAAYQEVLAEVRPMGGVTPKWSEDSDPVAAEAFSEAAKRFPSDWVERSNRAGGLYVGTTGVRAHYQARGEYERVTMERQTEVKRGTPPPDTAKATHRALTDEELAEQGRSGPAYVKEVWQTSSKRQKEEEGWVEYDDGGKTVWRRPMTQRVKTPVKASILLTRADQCPGVLDSNRHLATATHEFTHRFESVVPDITNAERSFLTARTTDANGEREKLVKLFDGKAALSAGVRGNEVAYADNFVEAYMGKDYSNGSEYGANAFEIMSTGTEAVFSGKYGGLVGAGRFHADEEMRAFVLGVLATAGRE